MRTHGLASTYRGGCRCTACTTAHSARIYEEKKARAARLAANPNLMIVHGRVSTYLNWLCRCPWCVRANSDNSREYKRNRRRKQLALES